jgi:methylated-DNA-[protein]-cysteine S-methyltransferase
MTVPASLDERFRDRAAADGALDVAYDVEETPVGLLLLAATERGVCRISFDADAEERLDELARLHGARVLRSPRPLDGLRRELEDYFEGRRRDFDVPLDLEAVPEFHRSVLEELVRIPYGETATYGRLAERLGSPRAARAVGGACNRNPVPIVVPCHRVVGSSGSLVGYAGGLERKRALLALEGAILA